MYNFVVITADFFLLLFSAFILSGCPKCSNSSSTTSAISKAEYIKVLDAICEKSIKNIKEEIAASSSLESPVDLVEKSYEFTKTLTQEMEKVPQPSEDSVALKEIWANHRKIVTLQGEIVAQNKLLSSLVTGSNGVEKALETAMKTQNQLDDVGGTMIPLLHKYGFKFCFYP